MPSSFSPTHRRAFLSALAAAIVVTSIVSISHGAFHVPLGHVASIFFRLLGIEGDVPVEERESVVLLSIRLPRVALGAIVGASLALAGAAMQGMFRNPLVDPGLLGVSSGAAFAAVCTIVLGKHAVAYIPHGIIPFLLPIAAFAGGLVATGVVHMTATSGRRVDIATLLLAGIAMNALTGAGTGVLTFLANDADLRTLTFWSLGSLGGASWTTVLIALPLFAVSVAALLQFAKPLNALMLGEQEARYLGFDIERTKRWITFWVALVVGMAVSTSGVIGFVGLIVPHLVRLVGGADHRWVLGASALGGATLMLLADVLARTVASPVEVPIGIVTSLTGAPFFFALLMRERRKAQ